MIIIIIIIIIIKIIVIIIIKGRQDGLNSKWGAYLSVQGR